MLRSANRWVVLVVVILAFVPIVIDMTILHIAVPTLTLALEASGTEILWIIDIYPLVMAGLLVPMGTLSDRVGHRRMLLIGLVVFLIASVFAAYSVNAPMLIAARAALAIGAAMVMPNVLAIIRHAFDDPKELGMAFGLWSTIGAAGAAIGPLTGGFLIEHFWWGAVFLINVPVMLLVWPLAFAVIPRDKPQSSEGWSIGQAAMLLAGLIATVFAIKQSFRADADLTITLLSLVVGLALLVWFVRIQLRAPSPMLDLTLFQRPAILAGILMALVVSGSLAGVELTIAQELQFVIGRSPLEAGLFLLPLVIATAVGGPVAGFVNALIGLRATASASLFLAALSLVGLGLADFHTAGWEVIALMFGLGLALSIGLTASSVAIMGSAPPEKAGAAGSLESTGYELGAGLGITFFGVLLSGIYSRALQIPPELEGQLPENAGASIGETMTAASRMGTDADVLVAAAGDAFSAAHTTVLMTAAGLIAVLAVFVVIALRHYRDSDIAAH